MQFVSSSYVFIIRLCVETSLVKVGLGKSNEQM